jgi:hypothetical protein
MNSVAGEAHGISLPLFSLMQDLEGRGPSEASQKAWEGLRCLRLGEDVSVQIVFDGPDTGISLISASPFGSLVLEELRARGEFPPCERGSCEPDHQGVCQWCARSES